MNAGIGEILQDLSSAGIQELTTQIQVFEDEAQSDFVDVMPEVIDFASFDANDPDEVYATMKELVSDPDTYQW